MAINFPSTTGQPTDGSFVFTNPVNDIKYSWNGVSWTTISSGGTTSGGSTGVDLTGYATEEYVVNYVTNTDTILRQYVDTQINTIDLTSYATKAYVDGLVTGNIDLSGYSTISYVDSRFNALSSTINNYATTQFVEQNFATLSYVDAAVGNVNVDLTGYATETYVNNQLANVNVSGTTVSTVTSSTTDTFVIDTFSMTDWRSADYSFTISATGLFYSTKILVVHDGTTVYADQYGSVGLNVGVVSVDVNGGNVVVSLTPASAGTEVKFTRTLIENTGVYRGWTFPLDLEIETTTEIDLMTGSGEIDLQTDVFNFSGLGPAASTSGSDITFPLNLNSGSGNLDLNTGSGSIDLLTGSNTAQLA